MSSLKRIVCLADSWKHQERCIAGIDLDTGKWVRPVCDQLYPEDGRIPEEVRLINDREPQLLEILEIPLADTGNNFGFESENLSILPGKWRSIGYCLPADLFRFCSQEQWMLHNNSKNVLPSYLKGLPPAERQTLQLVKLKEFRVSRSGHTWKAKISINHDVFLESLSITDPVLASRLDEGYKPIQTCFATLSLSMPWAYPDWQGEIPCWKLIAGFIPNLFPPIGEEMQRVGWSPDTGRNFIRRRFGQGKQSLRQLTLAELQQFLDHLKPLPSVQ